MSNPGIYGEDFEPRKKKLSENFVSVSLNKLFKNLKKNKIWVMWLLYLLVLTILSLTLWKTPQHSVVQEYSGNFSTTVDQWYQVEIEGDYQLTISFDKTDESFSWPAGFEYNCTEDFCTIEAETDLEEGEKLEVAYQEFDYKIEGKTLDEDATFVAETSNRELKYLKTGRILGFFVIFLFLGIAFPLIAIYVFEDINQYSY